MRRMANFVVLLVISSLGDAFSTSSWYRRIETKFLRNIYSSYYNKRYISSLHLGWFTNFIPTQNDNESMITSNERIVIGKSLGSGSYGTVSLCRFEKDGGEGKEYVAKRSWSFQELYDKLSERDVKSHNSSKDSSQEQQKRMKEKADRCLGYLDVEQKSLQKILQSCDEQQKAMIPNLVGRFKDSSTGGYEWIVFELIESIPGKPARCLKELMFLDWIDQKKSQRRNEDVHPLIQVQKELGMDDSASFDETLDRIFLGILRCLIPVHESNIVHRDIKPENILVGGEQDFVLIDFGSAADVDEMRRQTLSSMFQNQITTLSPIYAAPEEFVEWDKNPKAFDVFSSGLVFCQLLFNLLDDRTDAGFRQQLEEAEFDLDLWLERELQASLIPAGIEGGLEYLGSRPGLWGLLKNMLREQPTRRISSNKALKTAIEILRSGNIDISKSTRKERDGAYFHFVIEEMDLCKLPIGTEDIENVITSNDALDRQLHFVASFERGKSLGLILSEADTDEHLDEAYDHRELWFSAIKNSKPGDLFIRDIVKGSQADMMGIFEIGDRVASIDQFEFKGFDQFVEVLSSMPEKASSVVIHFDRKQRTFSTNSSKERPNTVDIISHGAFSLKGHRKAQEDSMVLHEFDTKTQKILLTAVFDGHGGNAASYAASSQFPQLVSSELLLHQENTLTISLENAWNMVCESYREGCMLSGSKCAAGFDASEGILYASTGGEDLSAGTTASIAAVSDSEVTVLNCGDSRTLIVGEPFDKISWVQFLTKDHKPSDEFEQERLRANPNFSDPECSMGKYWIKVGDYRYTLSRSLESSFVTSKGIISQPDVYKIDLKDIMKNVRSSCILVQASDGLFDVLDNEEVARDAVTFRKTDLDAQECAAQLAKLAFKKGSSDNISVIVVYFD